MKKNYIVVGLGKTGISCVTFLHSSNTVCVVDTRETPENIDSFKHAFPEVPVYCAQTPDLFQWMPYELVLTPGISPDHPLLQKLKEHALALHSDVSLFMQQNKWPTIVITGSNGKSTVTTLVGAMAKACGFCPAIVGNIGEPVLNLLTKKQAVECMPYNLVVIELSSFQLDITPNLRSQAAVVLNISPDHLDRYVNLQDYIKSKHQIYLDTECAIINLDDPLTVPNTLKAPKKVFFSTQSHGKDTFGLIVENQSTYLCFEHDILLDVTEMKISGQHNYVNALAALALGYAAGLPFDGMVNALREFKGLPHRCEWVADISGVTWVNDSKGTNIGASLAAITGLGVNSNIVLIMGGQGKNQDFSELLLPIQNHCRAVIVMGENKNELHRMLKASVHTSLAHTMSEAVLLAEQHATGGDIVLLSPACASFDQYRNFEHRGECYKQAVFQLIKKLA